MEMKAIADRQQKYVRISKNRLKETLEKNRTTHQQEWEKAIIGWRKVLAEKLETHAAECSAMADKVRNSDGHEDFETPYPDYPRRPTNHVAQYDEIIERLDYDLDEEIHLTHQDFNRFVRDNWEWKDAFVATSRAYSA